MPNEAPYLSILHSSNDLVTPYEAIRAGFVALALEKNRRATPFVEQARALKVAAGRATSPASLREIEEIQGALINCCRCLWKGSWTFTGTR